MTSNIATAFKNIREVKRLTQEELAEVLGVTAGHVGMIEQGRAKPSYEVMDKLVNEYGVDANSFFRKVIYDDEAARASLAHVVRNMNPEMKQMIKFYAYAIEQLSVEYNERKEFSDE